MPERYNFVTENFDDRGKGLAVMVDLMEFAENVHIHEFVSFGGRAGYFISGQSIEVDSNCGCVELRTCLQEVGIAAVFINDPSEYGAILKRDV